MHSALRRSSQPQLSYFTCDQLTTDLILRKSDSRVIWGNAKQGLLKAEVLNSLIETGVKPGVTIDVSSPKAPVVTYPNY